MKDSLHSESLNGGEQVCIPNISLVEQRKRLIGGVLGLIMGIAVLAILINTGAVRTWRLALFPLWMGATVGYFQAREKT